MIKITAQIFIIGNGIVGNATGKVLKKFGHSVQFFDKDPERCDVSAKTKLSDYDLNKADYIFVCVPTPTIEGKHNVSIVMDVMKELSKYDKPVILRCTVIPGTCDEIKKLYPDMQLTHMPEFITAKNAYNDALSPDKMVASGDNADAAINLFNGLPLNKKIPKIMPFDYKVTELAKYANNYLLASKVALANELYDMCVELGINYKEIQNIVMADPRIGHSHLNVDPEDRGFGGMCFPKDTQALLERFPGAKILSTILAYNKQLRDGIDNGLQKM